MVQRLVKAANSPITLIEETSLNSIDGSDQLAQGRLPGTVAICGHQDDRRGTFDDTSKSQRWCKYRRHRTRFVSGGSEAELT